jgi:hypothetical protein
MEHSWVGGGAALLCQIRLHGSLTSAVFWKKPMATMATILTLLLQEEVLPAPSCL